MRSKSRMGKVPHLWVDGSISETFISHIMKPYYDTNLSQPNKPISGLLSRPVDIRPAIFAVTLHTNTVLVHSTLQWTSLAMKAGLLFL